MRSSQNLYKVASELLNIQNITVFCSILHFIVDYVLIGIIQNQVEDLRNTAQKTLGMIKGIQLELLSP